MGDEAALLDDPAFQQLLRKRSRLRWGFSSLIVGAYLAFGIGGLLMPQQYAVLIFNDAISVGLTLGYLIIGASIVSSVVYVRLINRLEAASDFGSGQKQ